MFMRKHYLDNIRWATVLLVMFYHVNYLYNDVGILGNVAPDAGCRAFDLSSYLIYPWFMVLLFVIAGMSARYALSKRTVKQFLGDKVTKLLVPSTLGLFVYHWISGYFNVKFGGALDDIPSIIRYPVFVLSGTGPLWFIQTLFLFSLIIALIYKLDKNDKLWKLCKKANILVLLALTVLIWGSSFVLNMPVITVYRFGIYGAAYFIGYFVISHDEVQDNIEKYRIPLLCASIILGVAFTVIYFGKDYTAHMVLINPLTNAFLWITVLAILGCAKAWFNNTSPFADYMTKSSFGLYIVHYAVVVSACGLLYYYSGLPHELNYLLALVIEFPVTVLVYELFKRIPIIRYLVLGIKKKKPEQAPKNA